MTIPYMHNCSHQSEGWCLACVRKQAEELDEIKITFDLRWKADQRAIKKWQAAHPGKELTWPDHTDLVMWLAEQNDTLKQFAKDFLTWRNGPSGPEVIIGELGAGLSTRAEALIK